MKPRNPDPQHKANSPRKGPLRQGETHWSQASGGGLQRPVPQQPNERDESASSQAPDSASMEAIGKIAHHDAVSSQDTDRGPVLDAVYNKSVVEGHRVGDDEKVSGRRDPSKSTSSEDP